MTNEQITDELQGINGLLMSIESLLGSGPIKAQMYNSNELASIREIGRRVVVLAQQFESPPDWRRFLRAYLDVKGSMSWEEFITEHLPVEPLSHYAYPWFSTYYPGKVLSEGDGGQMTELQDKLQELRELVEAKTVECPVCDGRGWKMDIKSSEYSSSVSNSPCSYCSSGPIPNPGPWCSSGRIPDPIYVPLLEVVRVKLNPLERVVQGDIENKRYITRSWDELPKGALAGALWAASYQLNYLRSLAWDYIWHTEDIDLVACCSVIEALKEEAK